MADEKVINLTELNNPTSDSFLYVTRGTSGATIHEKINANSLLISEQIQISGAVTATEAMKNKVLIVTSDTIFTIGNSILSKDWTVRVIVKSGSIELKKGNARVWTFGNPELFLEANSDFFIRQEGVTSNLMVIGKFVSNPFMGLFDTRNTVSGSSNEKTIILNFAQTMNPMVIDWGDGTQMYLPLINFQTTSQPKVYSESGVKMIKIWSVDFSFASSSSSSERFKVGEVLNYGNMYFSRGSYDSCTNVRFDNTIGIPKFKSLCQTVLRGTLCTKINNLDYADWSVITNLSYSLTGSQINQTLGRLNVSNVTDFTAFMAAKTPADYSSDNYDGILNGWSERSFLPNKAFSFGTIKHTSGATVAKALWTRPYVSINIANVVNNGAGLMRVTAPLHGMTTGNKVFISEVVGGMGINRAWNVTVIDVNTVDLIGSLFSTAYTSGGKMVTGWGHTIQDGGL